MSTKKEFAIFLIAAGILSFLIGIYQLNPAAWSKEAELKADAPTKAQSSSNFSNQELLSYGGLLAGTVLIGTGCFLAGSLHVNQDHHKFTLDFTGKEMSHRI